MKNIPLTHFFHIEYVPKELQTVFLREYAANGAKHIALADAMILNIMANANDRIFYKDLVKEGGISYLDAHAPFGKYIDLNSPIAGLRKEKILRARLAMEIAAEFGIETITFHVGSPCYDGYTTDELHAEALRTIEELLFCAEKLGMILCIENVCNPSAAVDRLLDIKNHFPTDTLGFCFDSGHAHLAEYSEALAKKDPEPEKMQGTILEKMLPHIVNCHLHDNDGTIDNHRIPGNGTTDWKKIMPLLATAPRLKCIQNETSEPFQKNVSPGTSIRRMLESIDAIIHLVP